MKNNLLKSLLLGSAALAALTVWADASDYTTKVYVVDCELQPGTSTWVNLAIDNDNPNLKQWQCDIVPPAGVTILTASLPKEMTESPYYYDELSETYDMSITSDYMLASKMEYGNFADNEVYRLIGVALKGMPMQTGKHFLARLKCNADNNFTGGKFHIYMTKLAADKDEDGIDRNTFTTFDMGSFCDAYLRDQVTAATLAEVVANGEDDKIYKITDDLHIQLAVDAPEYAFVSDGKGNWMRIVNNDNTGSDLYGVLTYTEDLAGGTLYGTLNHKDGNQMLTIYYAPEEGSTPVVAEVEDWDLAQDDLSSDQWHFRPKVNQVINLKGVYNHEESKLYGYYNQGGQYASFCGDWMTTAQQRQLQTQDGKAINLKNAVALLKEPWTTEETTGNAPRKVAADDVHAYENYMIYGTGFNRNSDVLTGVENLNVNKNVVAVQYVNVAGQVSNTPFEGVNMVITRYADGTQTTTKVVK